MDVFVAILLVLLGFGLGTGGFFLSRWMIRRRSGVLDGNKLICKLWGWLVWAMVGTVATASMVLMSALGLWTGNTLGIIELMLVFCILACLSSVDNLIRKIPNELLAALLSLRIILLVTGGKTGSFGAALVGLAAGFMLFQLPAFLGISIGWGDVKLAAAAGFYLGLAGLFQAIAIMALVLGVYAIYLKLSAQGNLKTKVPMGPSFSLGILLAVVFPVISEISKNYLPGGF